MYIEEEKKFAEQYFELHKEEMKNALDSDGFFWQEQFGAGPVSAGLSHLAELINDEFDFDDDNQVFFIESQKLDWSGVFIQLGKFENIKIDDLIAKLISRN